MKQNRLVVLAKSLACFGHDRLFAYMARSGLILGALSLTVDDISTVPEANRALYVERDGKHHLDVTGVEDTAGLKSALEKERLAAREAVKAQKALEAKFTGIDPDQVRGLMAKFENDDEAKLIAAGKIEEVVTKRNEKYRAEMEKKMTAAEQRALAAETTTSKFSQRVLDNHIRAAATKAGLHSHAVDDALLRARVMFKLDDEGNPVQVDNAGNTVLGKDGKTPFSPLEWLEGMKETAPHWFPAGSAGGGAGGNTSGAGSAKTITRTAFAALSPQDRAKIIKTHKLTD